MVHTYNCNLIFSSFDFGGERIKDRLLCERLGQEMLCCLEDYVRNADNSSHLQFQVQYESLTTLKLIMQNYLKPWELLY